MCVPEAVAACRLYAFLSDELELKIDQVIFWTDSMIVLGYIKNVSRRFKTFVGNRIGIIHDATSPNQWRHVESSLNPADIASRGISASDKVNLHIWLNGPKFLWHDSEHWPQQQLTTEVAENDVEVKKEAVIHVTVSDFMNNWTDNFSDWRKLLAWLIKFKSYCRYHYTSYQVQCSKGNILADIQKAEHDILLRVQEWFFQDEMTRLKNGKPVKKDSRLASLNPILDAGLLRLKGRLVSGNTNVLSYCQVDIT